MQDLENLRDRLAQEEATLATTHEQIEAARRQIQALQGQIGAIQQQIATSEQQIAELHRHAEAIEKRIALLREYVTMVESAEERAKPATRPPKAVAPAAPAAKPLAEALPSLEPAAAPDELGDLSFAEEAMSTSGPATPVTEAPVSIDNLSEEYLTSELLPRTQTFEEELILVMAHHRKAIPAKDVARVFRRLDYAPKVAPTEKSVKAHVESDHRFFEYTAGGRIALTREGRAEAQRLLEQLR